VYRKIKFKKENVILAFILFLSAILNFSNLSIEGYGNIYYASGVKSMMKNFKNFFFVSFDPSGFVTIDKPPVGFWLQTISAKIFGFSGWSIIFPQALAGVISVALIYYMIKRYFGTVPALISALCLSITPITVATGRNNTIDNLLALTLIVASLAFSIAIEKGKLRYLIISLAVVGIGFNIKMLEAYLIVPAIYITYILATNISLKKRIMHLAIGTIVLLGVSLSWALVVDSIPAADRPFVGSSTNNTVIQLIIGHNGFQRLGINLHIFGTKNQHKNIHNTHSKNVKLLAVKNNRSKKTINKQVKSAANKGSNPGITRFFSENNLSDQISWLLPLAFIGFLALAIKEKLKMLFKNAKNLILVMWFLWLLTEFMYFSFTKGMFHTYYLTTMAPPIAALIGTGMAAMWLLYKDNGWKKWILILALALDGMVEILILSYNYKVNAYKLMILITATLCFVPLAIIIILQINNIINNSKKSIEKVGNQNYRIPKVLIAISFTGLLITPLVWSGTPIFYRMSGGSPSIGLEIVHGKISQNSSLNNNSKLINFLEANRTNEKYLVAMAAASTIAPELILQTGQPVMSYGGFGGGDRIITLNKFKELVRSGALRYVIVDKNNGGNIEIRNWITHHGKIVPKSKWQENENLEVKNHRVTYDKNHKKVYNKVMNSSGYNNAIYLYDLHDYEKYI